MKIAASDAKHQHEDVQIFHPEPLQISYSEYLFMMMIKWVHDLRNHHGCSVISLRNRSRTPRAVAATI